MARMGAPKRAFAVLLGKEGVGKTAVLRKICDEETGGGASRSCSCEISIGVCRGKDHHVQIIDPSVSCSSAPGCLLHHSLTYAPLNGALVLVEYHPRIGSTMVDDFWQAFSALKYEWLSMVVVLVTKMDRFKPGEAWPSIDHVQESIREVFVDDIGIDEGRIIFAGLDTGKEGLLAAIFDQVKDLPLEQLQYTLSERAEYFGIKGNSCQQKKRNIEHLDICSDSSKMARICTTDVIASPAPLEETSVSLSGSATGILIKNGILESRDDGARAQASSYWTKFFRLMRILLCVPAQDAVTSDEDETSDNAMC
ncbi:hypothetical protein ACHAXT_011857 [Thalassiosira profunda]